MSDHARAYTCSWLSRCEPTSCFRKDATLQDANLEAERFAKHSSAEPKLSSFCSRCPVRSREVKLVFLSCLFHASEADVTND
jgi:hypothetical protein